MNMKKVDAVLSIVASLAGAIASVAELAVGILTIRENAED